MIRGEQGGVLLVLAAENGHAWHGFLAGIGEHGEVYRLDQGLLLCERPEADLLIVDCCCQAEEGLRLLGHVKKRRPDLPVIFVTDASSEEVVTTAFKSGAREYFCKPFDQAEFAAVVGKILQLKRGNTSPRHAPVTSENGALPALLCVPDDLSDRLQRAIHYIEVNLGRHLPLDEIAREACLSKYHFSRMFKKQVGVSPIQFMLNLRIYQASVLLRCTECSVSTAAFRTGFNDLSEFHRQFKKTTGLTPVGYRKSAAEVYPAPPVIPPHLTAIFPIIKSNFSQDNPSLPTRRSSGS